MKPFKVKLGIFFGYNGKGYHGLQYVKNLATIEGELEQAIHSAGMLTDANFRNMKKSGWSRGSRTDKGVHAALNCVSVKLHLKQEYILPTSSEENSN
jgi:tRNA pseudouridine(38-40) synthase